MCRITRFVKKAIVNSYNENVCKLPVRKITPDEFDENYHLSRDLPLDEIGIVDVIQAVEDEFGVDFPLDFKPQTVGDLIFSVKTAN